MRARCAVESRQGCAVDLSEDLSKTVIFGQISAFPFTGLHFRAKAQNHLNSLILWGFPRVLGWLSDVDSNHD